MITVPDGVRIHLALGPTDMRKGFDGLALQVQEVLRANPFSGHLFIFRGKRAGIVKILFHHGNGMCLFAKRLDGGAFTWPTTQPSADGAASVDDDAGAAVHAAGGAGVACARTNPATDDRRVRASVLYPADAPRYAAEVRIALDDLPRDHALLHDLVRDLVTTLKTRDAAIESKDAALAEVAAEVERLRLIIRQFERARFGKRSEQLDPDQMAFGLEGPQVAETLQPPVEPSERPFTNKQPHRAPLPSHLPRVETAAPGTCS